MLEARREPSETEVVRIVFFGLPLAACLLARDGHAIELAALSRTDTPGRRRLARLIGGEKVLEKPKLDRALLDRVGALEPDLLVSWFWTNKIPPSFVKAARWGGFGVHPSLLPRHRGPDPTTWAILEGDPETGVTAHRIAAEYDTGAILGQRRVAIDPGWNAWRLAKALDRPSLALLREVAGRFADGAPPRELPQEEALATEAPFLETDDPRVTLRWTDPTDRILRIVRALAPSPGASTTIGDRDVTILEARSCRPPGVLEAPGEGAVIGERAVIRTGDGAIEILAAFVEDAPVDPRELFAID